MSPEEKLQLGITRLNESRKQINEFERKLVDHVSKELRKSIELRVLTYKQKQCVFKILKTHGFSVS